MAVLLKQIWLEDEEWEYIYKHKGSVWGEGVASAAVLLLLILFLLLLLLPPVQLIAPLHSYHNLGYKYKIKKYIMKNQRGDFSNAFDL